MVNISFINKINLFLKKGNGVSIRSLLVCILFVALASCGSSSGGGGEEESAPAGKVSLPESLGQSVLDTVVTNFFNGCVSTCPTELRVADDVDDHDGNGINIVSVDNVGGQMVEWDARLKYEF